MANIFLKKDDSITLGGANLSIFGDSTGVDTISLLNTARAKVNAHVDIVQLEGVVSDYKINVEGNQINFYLNDAKVAAITAQDDSDGTQIKFADTQASLKLSSLNNATLGAATLSSTATAFTKAQLSATTGAATFPADLWKKYNIDFDDAVISDNAFYLLEPYYTSTATGRKDDLHITKLNPDLTIAKQVFVGDALDQFYQESTLSSTVDGGIIFAGGIGYYDSYITKLNSNLEVVGTVKVGQASTNEAINDVASRADGKMVAVGYEYAISDAKDAYVLLLNSDMTVAAQKRIDNSALQNSNEEFYNVWTFADNSSIASFSAQVFVQFDANLNILRTVDFNQNLNHFTQLDNGKIYAVGYYKLFELNSDLSVAKAWSTNFDIEAMTASGNKLTIKSDYASIVQLDMTSGSPVVTSYEYMADRAGYNVFPYDYNLITKNDNVYLAKGGFHGSVIYAINPTDSLNSPNLAGDYRIYAGDKTKLTLTALNAATAISSEPLTYTASDINIVSSLTYTTIDATGINKVVTGDTLIA